ncbi:ABC transporter permease [Marinicella meishanensis]|uniref:ABC transporter permease n=1 Tax=Marinicella meishanensis TaxID=2873263 RepID=UPI001CBF40B0|nr:ABC transporter permease [Marinicella sp. NBU2979]
MFRFFLQKEIKDRYLGNSSALLWIIVHPLISLLIYAFVFGMIFKARVPNLPDNAFVTYLAMGLWPWMAFSESVLQSITAVINRKDLLGKVKLDLRQVVMAGTTANFLLHGLGFVAIIILLMVLGRLDPSWNLLLLLVPLLLLFILASALSLLFAAFYVFYRDLKQIISALLPLLFFCTPIIYSWSIIPEFAKPYLMLNPLLPVINFIHDAVFDLNPLNWVSLMYVLIASLVLLFLSNRFFQKLAPRFDDFA